MCIFRISLWSSASDFSSLLQITWKLAFFFLRSPLPKKGCEVYMNMQNTQEKSGNSEIDLWNTAPAGSKCPKGAAWNEHRIELFVCRENQIRLKKPQPVFEGKCEIFHTRKKKQKKPYGISFFHLTTQIVQLFISGQLYGLEKFWAFLKYSRKHVDIDPKLKEWLAKYKKLEDFRDEV